MSEDPEQISSLRLGSLYWNIRNEYFLIMHDASQAFDKIILTLSTIALGFNFGIVRYSNKLQGLCLTVLGCFLLILAIASSLYSLWLRQIYGQKATNHWSKNYKIDMEYSTYNRNDMPQFDDPIIKKMELTQGLSGTLFVIALLFLFIFICMNLPQT